MESAPTHPIEDYFPLEQPREKQLRALQFVERKVAEGCRSIVIEAPTGLGKSALGVTCCIWAGSSALAGEMGGYYLVTQKLLQDQLEGDFRKFVDVYKNLGSSLKSASEYTCEAFDTCQNGGQRRGSGYCKQRSARTCPYLTAYTRFVSQPVSVTNYPYFFTERTYVQKFPKRQVLVMDECHSIERQVLGFIEIQADNKALEDWAPTLRPMPVLMELEDFYRWAKTEYLPILSSRLEFLADELENSEDQKKLKEQRDLQMYAGKLLLALASVEKEPDNWVYWQESTQEGMVSIAKPIDASPYTPSILTNHADLKLYMSAYVGPKSVFCRNIGLDPDTTVFASLSSDFPVENRPIHVLPVGSMGRKSIDVTTPLLLRKIEQIMDVHATERGLIHVHSYKLGRAVYEYLMRTKHASRLLYPATASQRTPMLMKYVQSKLPVVLISPSMTEGFSFDDDLARWQIIAKMPYASLGDRQVAAKKDRDPEWYVLQTVSTLLQAAGRIVRSNTDHGVTYILDDDFNMLHERYGYFFPKWLTAAFKWH